MAEFPWKTKSSDDEWHQRTFLFYGPSGSGKTRLASQFPGALILSCDPGVMGGAASAIDGVKQMKISSYEQLLSLMPILQEQAGKEFKTLVIDSVTYMGKLSLAHILKSAGREMPRFDEFNLNYQRVTRLINNLSELNCHIVFTAIDKMDKDETTGKMWGGPDLVGKLAKELPQAVDVVCRLFTSSGYNSTGKMEVKYKFKSVADDTWNAKERAEPGKNILPPEGETNFEAFKPFFKSNELA